MACSFQDLVIRGVGAATAPGDVPDAISIQGKSSECVEGQDGEHITITLSCAAPDPNAPMLLVGTRNATVQSDGTFQVLFEGLGARCECGSNVRVVATCATDPACTGTLDTTLDCGPCPTILDGRDDVTFAKVVVECQPDGTATATITQDVQNFTPDPFIAMLECGPDAIGPPGNTTLPLGPGATGTIVGVCQYPAPGTPAPARIVILDANQQPTGCPSLIVPIPNLDKCSPQCPNLREVTIAIAVECEADPDDGTQKRKVTFTPVITGAAPSFYVWNFGDGTPSVLGTGPPGPEEHLYELRPDNAPELCILGPGGCIQQCFTVPLSEFDDFIPCHCETTSTVTVTIGDCETDLGDNLAKRSVTFSLTPTNGNATAHSWDFGDNTPAALAAGPPDTNPTHLYLSAPTDPPTLQIVGPDGCPDQTVEVPLADFDTFEPCGGGTPDPDPGEPESTACHGLALAAALFFAIAMLLGLFAACFTALAWEFGIAAGVAALVGGFIMLLYIWFCPNKACRWFLRMIGHSLMGAGMLAFMFSGCCKTIFIAGGVALIIAAYFTLRKWANDCNISKCDFLTELTLAVGYVLPANAIFAALNSLFDPDIFNPIVACVSWAGVSIVGGSFVALAIAALICKNAPEMLPGADTATEN